MYKSWKEKHLGSSQFTLSGSVFQIDLDIISTSRSNWIGAQKYESTGNQIPNYLYHQEYHQLK
jgi:hypothetical protein